MCTNTRYCKAFKQSLKTRNYLDICKFVGLQPIVCCPVTNYEELIAIPEIKNENPISADESMNTKYQIHVIYIYNNMLFSNYSR